MISALIDHLLFVLPLLGGTLLLLLTGSWIFHRVLRLDLRLQLVEQRNSAAAILSCAFIVGLAISLEALFFGRHDEANRDAILRLAAEGALTVPLLLASIWINDRLILYRFKIIEEIRDQKNAGVALGVSGSCIASGLVIDGVLTGFSATIVDALRDILLFWLLAQVLMVVSVFASQLLREYHFQSVLEDDDNLSVGISLFAFLVCIGFIARGAVVHAGHYTWIEEISISFFLATAGTVTFLFARWLLTSILTHSKDLIEEIELQNNHAAAFALAGVHIAIALLVSSCLQRPWLQYFTSQ